MKHPAFSVSTGSIAVAQIRRLRSSPVSGYSFREASAPRQKLVLSLEWVPFVATEVALRILSKYNLRVEPS